MIESSVHAIIILSKSFHNRHLRPEDTEGSTYD